MAISNCRISSSNLTIGLVLLWCLIQCVYAIMQCICFFESGNPRYGFTGSFYNPGPFACYLAVGVPVALRIAVIENYKLQRWFGVGVVVMSYISMIWTAIRFVRYMGRCMRKKNPQDFSLENQSKDTIYIRDIVTPCPCTEASVVDTVIPPGAVVPVNVRVKEDSVTGDFQRSVHIFYINFDNPTILGLSGRVI